MNSLLKKSASVLIIGMLVSFSTQNASAQKISKPVYTELEKREDSLKSLAYKIIFSENPAERFRSDSNFVKMFVRALKQPNSFYFPFDSLITISRLYAPDSSFRIFTWQLKKDEYVYLQEGAIQMNQPDGSLKLFPLFDGSMFTKRPQDSVRTNRNWIGAIYYKIVEKEFNGQKFYTLLGFDDFSIGSNKKWMDVLSFTPNGEPRFGGPFIAFKEDSVVKPTQARFSIQYKKEAKTRFTYDPELDLIIYDHLISESEEPANKETFIPDGDYEGFKWQNGQWVHIDKVFNAKLKDGDFPQEQKILDDTGAPDEQKLMEQSEKNKQKKPAVKPKPPVKKN